MIRLQGKMSGRDFTREIAVDLPEAEPRRNVLPTLWARARIDDLMSQDYNGIQSGNARPEVSEAIANLGLEFRLMTQFTSFVAVEEMTVTDGGEPRRIEVPVDIPEGVSHEGVFGEDDEKQSGIIANARTRIVRPSAGRGSNKGIVGGIAGGTVGGVASGSGSGVGPGNGSGVGPGTASNMGGGAPRQADAGKPMSGPASAVKTPPPQLPLAESLGLSARRDSPSPEDLKRRELLSKLHPSLAAVVERLTKKVSQPGPLEAKFVRNGKAEVQVWLNDTSKESFALLKQLGFEIILEPKTSKMVIGRLPIEKLEALANLKPVRYVSPMTTSN